MPNKFEYSDFPSTLIVSPGTGISALHTMASAKLHFTALEEALYIGPANNTYYMAITWADLSRVITWMQRQRKEKL